MAKQLHKKAKGNNHTKQQIYRYALGIVLALLVIAVALLGYFSLYMWQIIKSENGTTVKILIMQAIDGLSSPAPIEATTGKVYIPQARLVLPAPPQTIGPEVRYQYSPSWEDTPEELRIVNMFGVMSARSQLMGAANLEDAFKAVPELQSCARGYSLSFNKRDDVGDLVFNKVLANGRELNVYLEPACQQKNEDFENYLKTIDNY